MLLIKQIHKFLFIGFCFLSVMQSKAQLFIAGQCVSSDYCKDFIPDTVYEATSSAQINIDINQDGINDFVLDLNPGYLTPASQYYLGNISALNGNKIATTGGVVSCSVNNLARNFNLNDTINDSLFWSNAACLSKFNSSMGSGCEVFYASGGAGCIGLKLNTTSAPVFGWIKIVSLSSVPGSYYRIKIDKIGVGQYFVALPEQEKLDPIVVYPNPGNDEIYIASKGYEIQSVLCFDLNGKIVGSGIKKISKHQIDLSQLENGIYFIRIQDKTQTINKKIIVQH